MALTSSRKSVTVMWWMFCVSYQLTGSARVTGIRPPNISAARVRQWAKLGMDTTVEHVTDPARIAAYGVMSTPALVVRGRVGAYGRVLTKEEALKILKESLENPL